MDDFGVQDLFALDREVARAAKAYARWRASLASTEEDHADDAFDDVRRVSAKTTWDALGALSVPKADEPLRAALRRWVLAFVNARIGQADEVLRAKESAEPRGRVEGLPARRLAAIELKGGFVSWRDAWRGVVGAETPGEAGPWMVAVAENGPALADARKLAATRRAEIARRMGLAHPWEQRLPVPPGPACATAERFLARTEDLARAMRDESGGEGAGAAICAAVAREAGDGWPARLSHRWLEEVFGAAVRGLTLDLPAAPATLGAASFARAMASFGYALRVATAPASMPFALAREPWFVDAHRFAFTFGALAADPAFHQRVLGLGARRAGAQARVLARTALLEARMSAVRLLLDAAGPGARDATDELTARLFGVPVDPRLRGAWPAPRDDEPARWVGLLGAPGLRAELRETFDTDWFRNPRAWAHLRGESSAPAYAPIDAATLEPACDALARAFEEALG